MSKIRLDQKVFELGLVATRSQASSYIKLGEVKVDGRIIDKPGFLVGEDADVQISSSEQYVSRAGLKLASVAEKLNLDFNSKVILDIGSSTGGFTDFALRRGASKVIAVDVGTNQLHPSLLDNTKIELHERTDIRNFQTDTAIDLIVADLSFISLREVLPSLLKFCNPKTELAVMVKPQFEAGASGLKHKGVIKNDRMRRQILQDFEVWVKGQYVIRGKADSSVSGSKGNQERFYLLKKL